MWVMRTGFGYFPILLLAIAAGAMFGRIFGADWPGINTPDQVRHGWTPTWPSCWTSIFTTANGRYLLVGAAVQFKWRIHDGAELIAFHNDSWSAFGLTRNDISRIIPF